MFVPAGVKAQYYTKPIGGQRGTTFEIRYDGFGSAEKVEYQTPGLTGSVSSLDGGYFLETTASADAPIGVHTARLYGKGQVSMLITLQIVAETVIPETSDPHQNPSEAQPITWPCVVQGRINEHSERDFYVFEVREPVELMFEVITAAGLLTNNTTRRLPEPDLVIYNSSGSWFDPRRPVRMECNDESELIFLPYEVQGPIKNYLPRLSYRFTEPGLFLAEVKPRQAQPSVTGGNDSSYMLRIVPTGRKDETETINWTQRELLYQDPTAWNERDFTSKIEKDWLDTLWSRSVKPADGNGNTNPPNPLDVIREEEPNSERDQAIMVKSPVILEGTIDRPDDVDWFRFHATAGQTLVFEVRTPNIPAPHFSPQLTVYDTGGNEGFQNFFRFLGGDGDDWGKSLEPKTVHTFETEGEYFLKVRDLPTRRGDPEFDWQVLIRPKIPHVGRVEVREFYGGGSEYVQTSFNVAIGTPRVLKIVAEVEEAYEGDIALQFDNLPEGVTAIPVVSDEPDLATEAGQVYEDRAPLDLEIYRPFRKLETIHLVAASDSRTTQKPVKVMMKAVPILAGKIGNPIAVQELPVMVNGK